jgi:hypothetical protein
VPENMILQFFLERHQKRLSRPWDSNIVLC